MTVAIGTPGYMPIEQQNGVPNFNSDIYALGMTAIHAITGCHPDQLPRFETGEISWQDRAHCSPQMAEIIKKMVKMSPYQRYRTTNEVIEDLRKLQESEAPPTEIRPKPPISFSWKRLVWIIGIGTLLGIGLLIPQILRMVKVLGHYNQAQQLTEAGEYEDAIVEYNKAIAIKQDFAIAWTNRGFAQGKLGSHYEKYSSCAQATNVAPNFAEAWNCKGSALFDLKEYEDAIKEYDKAIAVDEKFYRAWYNKGEALIKLGRYEEAIAATRKVLAIEPDYFLAWTQICSAFFQSQQYQAAKTNCQQSLIIKPDYQPTIELMKKIEQKLQ